jgi:hypothetical protein
MLSYSIDMEAMKIARTAANNDATAAPGAATQALLRDDSGWNILAQAIDRILFLTYFLVIIIFLGAYLGGSSSSQ